MKVSAKGGTLEPLTRPAEGKRSHRWPQFLPNGKTLLFTVDTSDGFRPALLSMEMGEYRIVEELGTGRGARYLDSGHIVLAAEGQLLAARFDLDRLEVASRPVPVHDGIHTAPDSGLAYFTTSEEGDLLYLSAGVQSRDRRLVLVDRSGNARALFEERGDFRTVRFSPDGEKIAVTRSNSERRNLDVWIYDVTTGRRDRLTTAGARQAIWSPDGTRVAFTGGRGGAGSFLVKRVGGDVEEELVATGGHSFLGSWAPDGSALAYFEMHPETQGDLWVLNLDGATDPWLATEFSEITPRFSPDGRWLAYASEETGGYEIYVRPYPEPGARALISTDGGVDPVWSRDGRELFYRNGRAMMVVSIETEPSFSASRPQQLFTGPYLSTDETVGAIKDHYDISPDGEHFLMIEMGPTQRDSEIHLILDWSEKLERLIPTER